MMTKTRRIALALLLASLAAHTNAAPRAAARCATCHGIDGNSPNAAAPNLAAQLPAYIALQLVNFRSGERPNDTMKAIAAGLSDADIDALSHYFAGRRAKPRPAQERALAARGQAVFAAGSADGAPACASCHGARGQGRSPYPRIASQPAAYTSEQLKVYRTVPVFGNPLANVMKTVAVKLSVADAEAVAAYLATLR